MANVIYTVDIVYGSYSENGYQVHCSEECDIETIKAKVRRELKLDFLSMATFTVKIKSMIIVNENESA